MKDRLEENGENHSLLQRLLGIKDQKASLLLSKDAPIADPLLLFTILALALFGTAMVFSAGYAYADFRYDDSTYFMKRQSIFLAIGMGCVVFATPANGLVMFVMYYLFHGIAMGGINSAIVNMVFDYAPLEMRSDALAISQAAAGVMGFLTTVCISPLVTRMQSSGNSMLGVTVYAQQALSAISLVLTLVAMIYVRKVLIRKDDPNGKCEG